MSIINNCIFVVEFKIGYDIYDKCSINQAFDYGLDLNNFHEGSHKKNIIPILVADKSHEIQVEYIKSIDLFSGIPYRLKLLTL